MEVYAQSCCALVSSPGLGHTDEVKPENARCNSSLFLLGVIITPIYAAAIIPNLSCKFSFFFFFSQSHAINERADLVYL